MVKSFKERFDDNWICSMGGCFEWLGTLDRDGYGHISLNQRAKKAHRAAWYLATGEWPPADKNVCHHCDNPSCVRFDHLFIGTQRDNIYDCIKKGRKTNPPKLIGSNNPEAKLTESDVIFIRDNVFKKGDQSRMARQFSVNKSTISQVMLNKSWAHI